MARLPGVAEAAVREPMVRALEDEGDGIHPAVDGAEGLVRAAAIAPDATLRDMRMPVMDGWCAAAVLG